MSIGQDHFLYFFEGIILCFWCMLALGMLIHRRNGKVSTNLTFGDSGLTFGDSGQDLDETKGSANYTSWHLKTW